MAPVKKPKQAKVRPGDAENSEAERTSQRGRPFAKGTSGNPGGRPKAMATLQKELLAMAPEAIPALLSYIREPTDDEQQRMSVIWLRSLAKERLNALKIWFEFTVPKPKQGDAFDHPMPALPIPGELTTLGLVSDARAVVAQEVARLKAFSDAGIPLTETASQRLTECVRQLAVLVEQETKILEADPFAKLTDTQLEELRRKASNAN